MFFFVFCKLSWFKAYFTWQWDSLLLHGISLQSLQTVYYLHGISFSILSLSTCGCLCISTDSYRHHIVGSYFSNPFCPLLTSYQRVVYLHVKQLLMRRDLLLCCLFSMHFIACFSFPAFPSSFVFSWQWNV